MCVCFSHRSEWDLHMQFYLDLSVLCDVYINMTDIL